MVPAQQAKTGRAQQLFDAGDRLRTTAYRALPAPVELLAALRPLLVPVAVLALFAIPALPAVAALAVGVAVVALIVPWIGRSPPNAWRTVKAAGRLIANNVLWLVAFVVVTIALLYATGDATALRLERLDRAGGVPMALAIDATLIWIVAFVLRMVGFARAVGSLLRWTVAGLLALTMLATLMYLRLVPSIDAFDFLPLACLAATGVALLATWLHERGDERRPAADDEHARRWWTHGVIWSLLSASVLLLALVWSGFEVRSGRGVEVPTGVRADVAPRLPGQIEDDADLAREYMPVLAFSDGQRWAPEPVGGYFAAASIGETVPLSAQTPRKGSAVKADVTRAQPTRGALPTTCPPGAPRPCWYLHCDSAAEACARTHDDLSNDARTRKKIAAYVRVVRRGKNPAKDAAIFKDALPVHRGKVDILLQYWLFYAYDEWRASMAGANIVQRHAGDWEAVTVALSDRRPLWVGYSQHCGGRSRPWAKVRVADRAPFTHPLVAVAVGSHANYESAESVRSPDFSSCPLFPGESIALLSYAWNLRDRTRDDWRALPKVAAIVDEGTPPMNFPGYWGKYDALEFERFGRRPLDTAEGPRTPSRQQLWTDPMYKMFCGPAWRPRASSRDCASARRATQARR